MGWFRDVFSVAGAVHREGVVATASRAPAEVYPLALPADFPSFSTVLQIPDGRDEMLLVYGDPSGGYGTPATGVHKADPRWERANMVVARDLPGAWNGGSRKLYVHKKVEPHLREALSRAERAGVGDEIRLLGCFNYRHMRGDHSLPLSTHAFGIAVDANSSRNRATYFVGQAPGCWSDLWRRTWPSGLSETLVRCFESCGWNWGGRWRDRDRRGRVFVDPMHFELTR